LTSNTLLFPRKIKETLFGVPLADGVILWQSYLDTYGNSRILKRINMMSNAVKPLGAILLALFNDNKGYNFKINNRMGFYL
tara:strand:- start:1511 stop:1753 length:243 start_codon:yes stop_codon:yes gene_type:complete